MFKPKDSYRTKGRIAKKDSLIEGANHPNGVITHFYLKKITEKDSVRLSFTSMTGDTFATYSNSEKAKDKKFKVKEGGNTFVWNTRGKGSKKLEGMILWWANLDGAKAVLGTYKVSLNFNGKLDTQEFTILPDPRAEVSVADMQKQFDFITDVNTTIEKAHESINKIRKVTKQLDAFTKQYKGKEVTKALLEKAKKMKEDLAKCRESFVSNQK